MSFQRLYIWYIFHQESLSEIGNWGCIRFRAWITRWTGIGLGFVDYVFVAGWALLNMIVLVVPWPRGYF